jgi:VWFA-related protein
MGVNAMKVKRNHHLRAIFFNSLFFYSFILLLIFLNNVISQENVVKQIPKGQLLHVSKTPILSGIKPIILTNFTSTVIFEETFETGSTGWSTSGSWAIGAPTSGPGSGYNSSNCAATNLSGNYPNYANDWLISPEITLTPISSSSRFTLSFMEWFAIESGYDFGYVEISTDGGSTWTTLSSRDGTSDWRSVVLDITAYSNHQIKIAFHFTSDGSVTYPGWYIDNVQVVRLDPKPLAISFDQINSTKFPKIDCYVTVADSFGNPITGLADTNFVVYEDNVRELPITVTSIGATQSPISVAIVIDRSGSMSGQPISDAKTAASSFVDNLKPSDRACVISFNESVSIDQTFTSDKNALKNAINSLSAGGWTAIYDAAYTALSLLSSELNPRKAVILLTDGADNSSSFTPDSVIKYANFLGIPIHTIGLGLTPGSNEENALKNLSISTGGRYFYSPTSSQLIDLYNLISQQLQAQYLISYVTHNPAFDNTLRKVRVVVNYQSMSDSAERSYRAPGSANWSIRISSKVDSLSDLNNFAAVHFQASDSLDPYDIPKPPAPNSNYVYLYFPHPEWGGILGPNYSKDTRRARDLTNETIEWLFNVKTDQTGKNVLLEFNPDSLFPSDYTIVIYDLDAGIRKVLNEGDNTYTYNSGSGGERHFKLVVGGLFKTRNFQAGWNLVGIPLSIDSTLSSMFSDDVSTFYIYTYKFREGYKIDTTFTLGKGFWLGLLDSAVVDFSGTPVKDTISTDLDKYWNIISTPYLTPITKGNIFVERSGVKIPFDSAVSSGWISSALFGYDPRTKSYYLSDTLEPWLGYWFATLRDSLKLIYTPPSTAPSPKVIFADVKSDDRNWDVILSARLGDVLDKLAFFGIRDGASDGIDRFDYPKPPLPPGEKAIQVYFYHPEWNFELGPYFASDIRAGFGDVKSWKFYVRCLSGGEVKLSWDLSQVPGRFNFTLFDVSSGRVVDMRSVSEYVYNAVNNETREFRIDAVTGVSEENTIPKSYALYQNYPNPFNPSTTIEFDIPEKTNVKLIIYDILGREIETLIDKELEPGKYKLNFNATDLPSGVYFYTLRTPKFTKTNKMLLIK